MPQLARASWLSSVTVILSSFLLFVLEPMLGKQILPWFGGAAAVWATCLVFYQTALLLGYVAAEPLARRRWLHVALLAASLALLPIGPGAIWSEPSVAHPIVRILAILTVSVAVPFLLLSATGPLLQRRLSDAGSHAPYWLFIVSNAASLAGLFAYPVLAEPNFTIGQQRWIWSAGYLLFALLSGVTLLGSPKGKGDAPRTSAVAFPQAATWFALSAAGSMLLLSVTNHLTGNVAAVPFLWVLPLAVYLCTFMLAFTRLATKTNIWSGVAIFGLVLMANAIYDIEAVEPIQITVPVMLVGLFAGCMICHSELYLRRPAPDALTSFYVAIAAGGAAGSILVAVVAPQVFNGISELPFTLFLIGALTLVVNWRKGAAHRLLWAGVSIGMAAVFYMNVQAFSRSSLSQRRSFYGSLRVVQSGSGEHQIRTMFHGTIEHGAQFLLPPFRQRPTTYYGPDSGVGIALRECLPPNKSVGIVGLGVGTLAAYAQSGDTFRFYEINSQVVDLANASFFYLRESKAAIRTEIGDARLSLQQDKDARFDLLAIDAFSGDAIPVHLLTREALQLYRNRLRPGGVIAFHVSNNFLDLASVVDLLARDAGLRAALIRNHDDPEAMVLASDWVLVTTNASILNNAGLKLHTVPFARRSNLRPWTDEYNNLLQVLKTPAVR